MKFSKKSGFTLYEVMIAAGISALLIAGSLNFYVQTMKSLAATDQRLLLSTSVRSFGTELIREASRANQFILYKSAAVADRDAASGTDRQAITTDTPALCPAGDFIVFVYYEVPKPADQAVHRITEIIGYYLSATTASDGTVVGPVYKLDITFSTPVSGTNTIEDLLAANWSPASTSTVVSRTRTILSNVRGLAVPENIDGAVPPTSPAPQSRLFYMSGLRCINVSGQLYQANGDKLTADSRTYTDTFNFTVTPRSGGFRALPSSP